MEVIKHSYEDINLYFDKEKFHYRAEGNANLVLSLVGSKQVLRLRKSDKNIDAEDANNAQEQLKLFVKYMKLMGKLLGQRFTNQPTIAKFTVDCYDKLNNWLLPVRPVERLNKEIYCTTGIVCPDVTFLPDTLILKSNSQANLCDTFAVEIKPKQGWTIYGSDFRDCLDTNLFDLKDIRKCRFCCVQYIKLKQGLIDSISDFCSIDLFSGVRYRMRRAIRGLTKSPQNNFRISKNGCLIYGNRTNINELPAIIATIFNSNSPSEGNFRNFCDLLINILLCKFSDNETKSKKNIYKATQQKDTCEESDPLYLPDQCVLKSILNIQLLTRSSLCVLDNFDKTDELYGCIKNLLQKINCDNNCPNKLLEALNDNEKYLLGATALDCSVMLTFQMLPDNTIIHDLDNYLQSHVIRVKGYTFMAKVTIMDLDPKTNQHFHKYIKQTNESHLAYKQYNLNK